MSYDLLVFDAKAAPPERDAFIEWYDAKTEWEDDEEYGDLARCTPELRAWFMEMIQKYPAMNGPLAPQELPEDDSMVTDYSLGQEVIYIAFSWSKAEQAFEDTKAIAAKHGVGFFNVSSDTSDVWLPDGQGGLHLAHQEA
jgi:hypothetical protein